MIPLRASHAPLLALVGAGCHPGLRALECDDRPGARLDPPDELARIEVEKVDAERSEVAWGRLLLNQFRGKSSWVSVIDGCGQHEWWRSAADPGLKITRVRSVPGTGDIQYSEYHREQKKDLAWIHRVDPDTDEVVSSTRALLQHHDWVHRPDGRLAFLSYETRENLWFEEGAHRFASDAIRITDEGDPSPHDEVVFSIFDDSGLEPWWTCEHMRQSSFLPFHTEWTHTNSLIADEQDEAYYILVRYWDSVLKVGFDGELEWILGGIHGEFELVGDGRLPSHGHTSEIWSTGMLVFDNGDHQGRPSRVVEYAIDQDARTVREVWSFDDPEGRFANHLGDARRLPGGNVLVTWSPWGHLTEVTREGRVVWEARSEQEIGRPELLPEGWR